MEHKPLTVRLSHVLDTECDMKNVKKIYIDDLGKITQMLNYSLNDNDIFLIKNILTEDECKKFIQITNKIGYGTTGFSSNYRGYLRLQINDQSLADLLWLRIKNHIPTNIIDSDNNKWCCCGLNVRFKWAKYPVNTFFNKHCDSYYNESKNKRSFYTLNIYLNTEFNNGATRFFADDIETTKPFLMVKPEVGMGLVFMQPENKYIIHDGEKVCDGEKYIMRTDIIYVKEE